MVVDIRDSADSNHSLKVRANISQIDLFIASTLREWIKSAVPQWKQRLMGQPPSTCRIHYHRGLEEGGCSHNFNISLSAVDLVDRDKMTFTITPQDTAALLMLRDLSRLLPDMDTMELIGWPRPPLENPHFSAVFWRTFQGIEWGTHVSLGQGWAGREPCGNFRRYTPISNDMNSMPLKTTILKTTNFFSISITCLYLDVDLSGDFRPSGQEKYVDISDVSI